MLFHATMRQASEWRRLHDDPDNEVVLISSDGVFRYGFAGEALVSIDCAADGTAYAMGEEGSVIRFAWSQVQSDEVLRASRELIENDDAAATGPMRRIRVIAGIPICVGSFGQVYSLSATGFEALPFLEVYDEPVTIKDIAGTSSSDMVAVTQQGHAARYDGSRWVDLPLFSVPRLSGVSLLSNGNYAIAGAEGRLFVGQGDRWDHYRARDAGREYYGVASDGTHIYLAHIGGVDALVDGHIEEVSYDSKVGLEFAFLREGSGCVWSCCGATIGRIADRTWVTTLRGGG